MRLKVRRVRLGLHPSEVVIAVASVEGAEMISVAQDSVSEDAIEIGFPLRKKGNQWLIELPRETQSGAWRIWVDAGQLVGEPERMTA